MDSPKTAQLTSTLTTISATATLPTYPSESPPDSFSDYFNDLSPIEPGKSDYAAQGFTGLESPPFVFSSPHLNANEESNLLKRTQYAQSSYTELVAESQENNSKVSEQIELCYPGGLVDKILADFEEVAGTSIIQALSNKAEQNIEENLAPEVCRPVKSVKEQSSTEFYSAEFDFSTSQAFKKQGNEDLFDQDAYTVYQDCLDCMPQSFHQRFANANSHGAYECNTKETIGGPCQPLSVVQPQPSMCQRYLQFKEATANAPQNNFHSSNFTSNVKATSHYPSLVEDAELSVLNLDAAFNNRVPANLSHSFHTLLHPDSGGNPPLGVFKRSGVGLHLNSVINVAMKNPCPIAGLGVQGVSCHIPKNENICSGDISFSAEEKKPSGIGLHLNSVINAAVKNHGPIASFGVRGVSCHKLKNENACSGNVSFSAEEKQGHESKAISLTSSITLESCNSVKAEKFETLNETRNFDFDQSFNLEKTNNLLPKRKRKKSSVNRSGDDSKRCNCTKTKCLKLYCDCFAAGIYCPESCSCQGCFNNPENVHTVLETRHQIESRDPLAFAPKVIEDRNELPVNNENGSLSIPSSSRHKKGCKCKKSLCLKQYCECFQANVGCTDICRCEDCGNVHGKREEHCATPEVASGRADVGRLEGRLIDDHDVTALRKHISHSEFHGQQQQPNFAPQTPSFQYSDHEKDSPKSRLMSRRCLPSPELDSTSSSSPDCNGMFVETKTDILDVDSYQWQQMNCDNGGTSSTSSIASKPRGGLVNVSRIGQLSIGSSSISWRHSPDTPLIQAGKTSINCINKSSPKKKQRVLPPQHGSENEIGMNNSLGKLKSRRYVLKSMPPFPPLTPRNE